MTLIKVFGKWINPYKIVRLSPRFKLIRVEGEPLMRNSTEIERTIIVLSNSDEVIIEDKTPEEVAKEINSYFS